MKLRNLIIMVVIGPIAAYLISQILWLVYDLFGFMALGVKVSTYDTLSTITFFCVWVGFAFYGLKPKTQGESKFFKETPRRIGKKVKAAPKVAAAKIMTNRLDSDFTIKDVTKAFQPSKKEKFIEVIVMGKGKNLHQKLPYKKDLEYKGEDGTVFKIKNENLMMVKPFWGARKLVAIFNDKAEPQTIANSKSNNKITAEVLNLADRSTTLGKTVKEMFSEHMGLKKILFFVAIGIAAVAIFIILSGGFI